MTTIKFQTLDDNADATFNQLLGINDRGEIAGYFGIGGSGPTPAHPNKGYTLARPYTQNDYTNENFPGSVQTQVTGLNNDGLTVGFWVDGNGDNYGFVDRHGQYLTAIDPNAPAPTSTAPVVEQFLGVNDRGIAVGFYTDASGTNHGFTYDIATNKFSAINILNLNLTATAINDRGDIAGFVQKGTTDYGFLIDKGHVQWLFGPRGSVSTQVLGVNDKDDVVGSYMDKAGNTHGFYYDAQTKSYTAIDDPNANGMTVINGLNDKGQLVGFYLDANGNTDGLLVTLHGHKI